MKLLIVLAALCVVLSARSLRQKRQVVDKDDPVALGEAIFAMFNGELDFPTYDPNNLPETNFKCEDQEYPGFYADLDLDCQLAWQCDQERNIQGHHICPNMTVFSQEFFVCMWAPTVDCQASTEFYSLNANLYQGPDIDLWGNTVERYEEPSAK